MEKIITLSDISYKYHPNAEKLAIDNVNLEIEAGEWVAIIGHNGSGKSTLAKTINGLLAPTNGTVTVGGHVLTEESVWDIRRMVGMVFQNPDNQFVGSTVQDDVAFGLENIGIPRDEMIKRVTDAIDKVKMGEFLEKEPARLSGGQKQRVAIAGVVALKPNIIILDEATSMLDPQGRAEVLSTVREIKDEANLTVISITHDINEAASANRILVMDEGRLIREGTPEEIFSYGDELIEMGLDLPFPEKLKSALSARNIDVPKDYLTEEGMVDWLWTLLSKK